LITANRNPPGGMAWALCGRSGKKVICTLFTAGAAR